MRILLSILILLAPTLAVADQVIQKGATDQWVQIKIVDAVTGAPETSVDPNTPGLDLEYARTDTGPVDLTEVADTDPNSHSDGSLYEIGHGNYLVGLPDAAVAWGADFCVVQGTATDMLVLGQTVQLTSFDLQESQASRRIGRTWYVDNQTEGYGSDGSKEAPFNTIAAAVSVVESGDTIYLFGGSTYAETVDLSSTNNVTLCGESRGAVSISAAVATQGDGLIECGNGTTVRDLSATVSSGDGAAIAATGKRNIVVERVTAVGKDDGLFFDFTFSIYNNAIVRDSYIFSEYDGIRFKGGAGNLVENCDIQCYNLVDPTSPPSINCINVSGLAGDSTATVDVRNTNFYILADTEHASDSHPKYAINLSGANPCFVAAENCRFTVIADDPNDHGDVAAGRAQTSSGIESSIVFKDCGFDLRSDGDGTVTIGSAVTDDAIELVNCQFSDTIGTGTFERTPQATYATSGGLLTGDANNRAAGIQGTINDLDGLDTAQDTQHASTQSLVTTVDTVVDSISTAVATVDTVVDAIKVLTDQELDPNQAGSLAALADTNLDDQVSEAVAGSTETRDLQRGEHAWTYSNRVTGNVEFKGTLVLAPGEAVRGEFQCGKVLGVSEDGGNVLATMTTPELTVSSSDLTLTKLGIDADDARVLVTAANDATAGLHYVKTKVTTTANSSGVWLYGKVRIVDEPTP